jgi:predicted nucleic acid-binding protein
LPIAKLANRGGSRNGILTDAFQVIHLNTNMLIDPVTSQSAQVIMVHRWVKNQIPLEVSVITWSEFFNSPHTEEQKNAVHAVSRGGIQPFTQVQAEFASRLFHMTGCKRGSHVDCVIAAAASCNHHPVATRHIAEFERFIPYGIKVLKVPTIV